MLKFHEKMDFLQDVLNGDLPIEAQINVLYEIMENILDQGAIRARTVKFKLQKYIKSKNMCEKVYNFVI